MTPGKRALDLAAATLGVALLSPLFLMVGALVKLGDGGSVFFRQTRVGQGGQHFRLLKFRTMSEKERPDGMQLTAGRDPRITRVGGWLRKWKLDELPQLLNVIAGDMSLVGPRPEVPRYVAHYTDEQRKVLRYRPGITDPASIRYQGESDLLGSAEDPERFYLQEVMPEKLKINLEYARQATVWSDLRVILATIGALVPRHR